MVKTTAELTLEPASCIVRRHLAVLRPAACRATFQYSAGGETSSSCTTTEDRSHFVSRSSRRRWESSAARRCRPTGCCERGTAIPTSTPGWCRSTRCRRASSGVPSDIKYLRTIATQLCYWPLLLRELQAGRRRPRLLRVLLLVPPRAAAGRADREAARQAGRHELPQRRGARSPAALGDRARDAALGRAERRPLAIPPGRLRASSASAPRSSRTSSTSIASVSGHAQPLRAEGPVDAQLRSALQRRLHAARVPARAGPLPGRDADAGGRGLRGGRDCGRWPASCGSQNVRFAGRVAPADIWRYYADADIYLQTPDIDNMPSSVLEAFASGCAVVSTNAGGVPAILTDERHGLLVECGDHAAAAERDRPAARRPGARGPPDDAARESCDAVPVAGGPLASGWPFTTAW